MISCQQELEHDVHTILLKKVRHKHTFLRLYALYNIFSPIVLFYIIVSEYIKNAEMHISNICKYSIFDIQIILVY